MIFYVLFIIKYSYRANCYMALYAANRLAFWTKNRGVY